jgi:hypothetical protein
VVLQCRSERVRRLVDLLRGLENGLGRPLGAGDDGRELAADARGLRTVLGAGHQRSHVGRRAADGVVDRRKLGLVGPGFGDLGASALCNIGVSRDLRLHRRAQRPKPGRELAVLLAAGGRCLSRAAYARTDVLLDAEDLALDRHGRSRCRALSVPTLKMKFIGLSILQPLRPVGTGPHRNLRLTMRLDAK